MELRTNSCALSFSRRVGVALAFAATLLVSAMPATAQSQAPGESIVPIGCWFDQQEWWSPNQATLFTFQNDGNLVVYWVGVGRYAKWDSKTVNRGHKLCFQADGNLVMYDYDGNPIFHSHTYDNNYAQLVVQDDGNVVIYRDWPHVHANALWHTHTYRY